MKVNIFSLKKETKDDFLIGYNDLITGLEEGYKVEYNQGNGYYDFSIMVDLDESQYYNMIKKIMDIAGCRLIIININTIYIYDDYYE
jgi:hypothetical protein